MKLLKAAIILMFVTQMAFAGTITPTGINQEDLVAVMNDLAYARNYGTLCNMGVTSATTYLVITTGGPYKFNGNVYTSTASNTLTFSTGHKALAASQKCIFTVGLTAAGVVGTLQSRVVSSAVADPDVVVSTTYAPIAKIKIVTNSTGVFTPNTTNISNASCTVTTTQMANKEVSLTVNE